MTDSRAYEVVSDHRYPLAAAIWLAAEGGEPRPDSDDGTWISWWIALPGQPAAAAGVDAASWVRDHAPGCTHADWWPPQRVEVGP